VRHRCRILALLAGCTVALLLIECDNNPASSKPPDRAQLTITDSLFQFGYCPQSSTVTHIFWLYSTGSDTLKILSVKPG
jgi:hypothetical protein